MYQVEDTFQINSVDVKMIEEDPGILPYGIAEVLWGIVLLIGIFLVNISVLWVVSRSRELWKPRHLWMACLCVTDIFVGVHKALELLIFALPYRELCVLQRATLGIPYVINMLILSLLSLDRFIAVRYPFFYSASISNKHVLVAFLVVLLVGCVITVISISFGLRDPICRTQSVQLVYLTIVLMICSVVTLFFNSSVLRIAKRQLNAIYAQEPLRNGRRRVSVVCTNCGYKNETFVNTLLPLNINGGTSHEPVGHKESIATNTPLLPPCNQQASHHPSSILPLTDPVVLGPLDLDLNLKGYDIEKGEATEETMHLTCEPLENTSPHLIDVDETTAPLVRTLSLPTIPDSLAMPISVVVQPDPALRPSVVIGNHPTDVDLGCIVSSMSNLDSASCKEMPVTSSSESGTPAANSSSIQPGSASHHLLPRSRSLMTCRTHQVIPNSAAPRLQLFRNLHFARTHMFHVGRLFPSIRFARTVLLIMIPMWVFILPIVTIIPLHRGCQDGNKSELNCEIVDTMWRYLFVHMRSILPLQAILDTLIYAFGSKEFRQALKKLLRKYREPKQ